MVQFSQTDKIKNLDGIVGQEAIKLIESTPYVIKKQPKESSTENVLVKYEILFNKILPDGSLSKEQESYVVAILWWSQRERNNFVVWLVI